MTNMSKNIVVVAGARPNFMKIAPLMRELEKVQKLFSIKLVHTGQHYDNEMSDIFFEELEIRQPDCHLEVGSGSHAEQTARIMIGFEQVCVAENPDLVIVVGDVNSTLACAIVAKKLHIKVAHIEAGLRSNDISMPEEINRIVTDSISDYLFVTERNGVENLIAEGKSKESIHFVGHVMIDNLFYQVDKLSRMKEKSLPISSAIKKHGDYGVVTLHRPSNVDNKLILEGIISALKRIGQHIPIILPLHPRTRASLEKFNIELNSSIEITKPLPYMEFLNLWKDAKLVLTDSGGLQEETTGLNVPCITLRENTERPVTVLEGTNEVVGVSPERIYQAAKNTFNSNRSSTSKKPDLWDGKASERIVRILKKEL